MNFEERAASLRAVGWTCIPPTTQAARRPDIESFRRDAYQQAASRKGWKGGSVARDVLTPTEIAAADARASREFAALEARMR